MSETKLDHEKAIVALEKVAKRRDCKPSEVNQEEIKAQLRDDRVTTSASTSGPILRSVIADAKLADTFSIDNLSIRLKSAASREFERFTKEGAKKIRELYEEEGQKHDKTLDELDRAITGNQELTKKLSEAQTKLQDISNELSEERGKTLAHENTTKLLREEHERTHGELTAARENVGRMTTQLAVTQSLVTESTERCEGMEKVTKTLQKDLLIAQGNQRVAEEQSKLREEVITELKDDNKALRDQLRELNERHNKAQDNLLQATVGQADAAARLDERSKPLQSFEATLVEETTSEVTEETQNKKTQPSTSKTKSRGRTKVNTEDKSKTGT